MNISEGRLNHLEDRSKKLTKTQLDGNRMRLHLHALTVFVNTGGNDFDELAAQFPRTWNAITTNDPTSWDLPSEPCQHPNRKDRENGQVECVDCGAVSE